jgi:hypothetical protein
VDAVTQSPIVRRASIDVGPAPLSTPAIVAGASTRDAGGGTLACPCVVTHRWHSQTKSARAATRPSLFGTIALRLIASVSA